MGSGKGVWGFYFPGRVAEYFLKKDNNERLKAGQVEGRGKLSESALHSMLSGKISFISFSFWWDSSLKFDFLFLVKKALCWCSDEYSPSQHALPVYENITFSVSTVCMKSHFDARSELLTIVLLEVLYCVCLFVGGGPFVAWGFCLFFCNCKVLPK